ncbi:NUDIX hydrolase [Sutcliffiella rhizosphaerae]|uniref:Nudix hydrolase domain-containing protein n=1 Tax=Sutcliffiella rhizosphaerae TaxID=2880967 RepID=A0ABM8YKE7_9BACI|nr:NUDIX domain-containing protein [Sutcliffiella rhizosphaerae]CAG9620412.1 hypothetical protein BACCIP111883_01180 [Sutcliffiella rhizosphaerae]
MTKWYGASGLCMNEQGQILMVLQGKLDEKKVWSIPSGGIEGNETYEECCIKELKEETGYEVKIIKPLFIKEGNTFGIDVVAHYFEVEVIGGEPEIKNPDNLIYEISWKSIDEIKRLEMSFPEDRQMLINYINEHVIEK